MDERPLIAPKRRLEPFQAFIMSLCLVTGLPVVFGRVPAPGSVEESLPRWAVVGWSIALVAGSAAVLTGMLWRNRIVGMMVVQVGLVCVGSAAVIYGILVAMLAGDHGGAVSSAIIAGFGGACFWRWAQLQKDINSIAEIINDRNKIADGE